MHALTSYAATGGDCGGNFGRPERGGRADHPNFEQRGREHGGSVATSVLASGFGIVPLIGGLLGLFGGGSPSASPPLQYQMPAPISFMSADTGGGLEAMDYDQSGYRGYTIRPSGTQPGATGAQGSGSSVQSGPARKHRLRPRRKLR